MEQKIYIIEELMAKMFPNQMKYINIWIQGVQQGQTREIQRKPHQGTSWSNC